MSLVRSKFVIYIGQLLTTILQWSTLTLYSYMYVLMADFMCCNECCCYAPLFGHNTCWFERWLGHAWLVVDTNMHYSSVQLKHAIGDGPSYPTRQPRKQLSNMWNMHVIFTSQCIPKVASSKFSRPQVFP
jgi:hypothetical protein